MQLCGQRMCGKILLGLFLVRIQGSTKDNLEIVRGGLGRDCRQESMVYRAGVGRLAHVEGIIARIIATSDRDEA